MAGADEMDEFALIRRYFSGLTSAQEGVSLGIGDDCALLSVPAGQELAVSTDTLIAGRHFPEGTAPFDIGWKSLAVNLSDLAAMGAEPRWFTLALTLPEADAAWLQGFAQGLKALADQARIALVGGDTTRGPLSLTITVMGLLPAGTGLKRSGAQAGDLVCVTGTLGDAALALWLDHGISPAGVHATITEKCLPSLRKRLTQPTARVSAGIALRDLATAAIDLSDGLAGDLGHILTASGVGAEIWAQRLPMSSDFKRLAPQSARLALQTQGGDDYELCVCLPPDKVELASAQLDVQLTVIGRATADAGLRFLDASGATIATDAHGFRHFGAF
jgi:thiamine-monophosphate kinase